VIPALYFACKSVRKFVRKMMQKISCKCQIFLRYAKYFWHWKTLKPIENKEKPVVSTTTGYGGDKGIRTPFVGCKNIANKGFFKDVRRSVRKITQQFR
jgi:hypothetical protein